jgi:hypothetical protein
VTSPTSFETPPSLTECMLGAVIADRTLREPFLGDLAEEFATRCEERARRWYRAQAAWSAPHLMAACWWPAPTLRRRRLGALVAGVAGGYLTLQLLQQAAQLVAGLLLTHAGHSTNGAAMAGWEFVACSLVAGAGCAVLGGYVAARALPDTPLAAALTLAAACGALAVTGMLVNGGVMPLWYWGGLQLLLLPLGTCLGGLVRAQVHARQLMRSAR